MKELNPCSREVSILSENQLTNKYGEPTPKKCMDNYRSWHESKMSLAASKTLRNSKFSHPQLGSNIWFLPTWLLAIPPSLGDGSLCHSRWPRCLPGSDASGLRVGLAGQENLNVESLSSHSLEFRLLLTDLSSSLSLSRCRGWLSHPSIASLQAPGQSVCWWETCNPSLLFSNCPNYPLNTSPSGFSSLRWWSSPLGVGRKLYQSEFTPN